MSPVLILAIGLSTVITLMLALRVNAFVALYVAALTVSLLSPGDLTTRISRVAIAFGNAAGKIGIVIALAAVIGTCMTESGAADRIVAAFTRLFGVERGHVVLAGSGFLLSVPVFFDTVFYLLVPLARSFHLRTGKSYLKALLSIAAGGVMTHTLVPPTPGPLAAASALGVDLGVMIVAGSIVGCVGLAGGAVFTRWIAQHLNVPLRPFDGQQEPQANNLLVEGPSDRTSVKVYREPPLSLSLLPVLLPVLLIGTRTTLDELRHRSSNPAAWQDVLSVATLAGDPNAALLLSMGVALYLVRRQRGLRLAQLERLVETALKSAGILILITAAGAAFGEMLKEAQVSRTMTAALGNTDVRGAGLSLMFLAFGAAAVLKIAQGSSTAAIIVTSAVLAAIIGDAPIGYHPVYLALATGSGSLVGSWMNDSGFWIFSRMGGLTERETLETWSPLLAISGSTAFVAALLGAALLPLR